MCMLDKLLFIYLLFKSKPVSFWMTRLKYVRFSASSFFDFVLYCIYCFYFFRLFVAIITIFWKKKLVVFPLCWNHVNLDTRVKTIFHIYIDACLSTVVRFCVNSKRNQIYIPLIILLPTTVLFCVKCIYIYICTCVSIGILFFFFFFLLSFTCVLFVLVLNPRKKN